MARKPRKVTRSSKAGSDAAGMGEMTRTTIERRPSGGGISYLSFSGTDTGTLADTATATAGQLGDEPVYNAGTQTLVIDDDFESYTSTQDVIDSGGWRVTNNSATASSDTACTLQTTGGRNGGKFLRLAYSSSPPPEEIHAWSHTSDGNAGKYATPCYGEVWIRMGEPDTSTTVFAMKFIEWFKSTGAPERAQLTPNSAFVNPATYPDCSPYSFWPFNGDSSSQHAQQPVRPYPFEHCDGTTWFKLSWAYRTQSTAGAKDGYFKAWINGTQIIWVEQSKVGVTPPGGYKQWCQQGDVDTMYVNDAFSKLQFGANLTSNSGGAFNYDFDDLLVWRD